MVFSSGIFLFAFLPMFLAVYFLTPSRWRNIVIVIGSYIFYAWWRVDLLFLLVGVTIWSYVVALLIHAAERPLVRNLYLFIGVAADLGALAYYKYANFFMDTVNAGIEATGGTPYSTLNVILPIGISFFVFQSISYFVDVWRRDVEPARSFIDLAAFKALFPQLIAGPVLRYKDLDEQFRTRTHTWEKFGEGWKRFIFGLALKVGFADSVAPLADRAFLQLDLPLGDVWLGVIAYSVQLFCDFGGYSSMAIGLGLMMGFRFVENFNEPYASRSITEFWRRWHISLSTWLRDYLYIPLGGNREGPARTYLNLFLTMLLGGLWHGANWTFILWGAWHGGWMCIERAFGGDKNNPRIWAAGWAWPVTMLLVIIGWTMFRAPDLATALNVYEGMIGLHGFGFASDNLWSLRLDNIFFLALALIFIGWRSARVIDLEFKPPVKTNLIGRALDPIVISALFVMASSKMLANSYSPFLYFQF